MCGGWIDTATVEPDQHTIKLKFMQSRDIDAQNIFWRMLHSSQPAPQESSTETQSETHIHSNTHTTTAPDRHIVWPIVWPIVWHIVWHIPSWHGGRGSAGP